MKILTAGQVSDNYFGKKVSKSSRELKLSIVRDLLDELTIEEFISAMQGSGIGGDELNSLITEVLKGAELKPSLIDSDNFRWL